MWRAVDLLVFLENAALVRSFHTHNPLFVVITLPSKFSSSLIGLVGRL
jgi:hypothetical protein